MFQPLRSWLNNLLQLTLASKAVRPAHAAFYMALSHSILLAIGGYLFFIPLLLWLGLGIMALVNLGSVGFFMLLFFANRRGYHQMALLGGAAEVTLHTFILVRFTGWEPGFHYYLTGLVMLIFLSSVLKYRVKVALALLLGLFYLGLFNMSQAVAPLTPLSALHVRAAAYANFFMTFMMFAMLGFFYHAASSSAESELRAANQALALLARTDPLTQLWNRRSLMEYIESQVQSFETTGKSFVLLLGDVDDFKSFNDRFGHECGDSVLTQLAVLMRASLREEDRLARWGGEEFLALLPETELEEGGKAAERLRQAVEEAVLEIEGEQACVTMTFGVCRFNGQQDALACIRQADKALYLGKRQGRNRVVRVEA